MKYAVRAIKYLIYFVIIFFICLAIVVLFSHQSFTDIPSLFKEGSLLPICLIFLFFAAVYPAVGYRKARLTLDGEWADYRDTVVQTMESGDYKLVSEEDGKMVFRHQRPLFRLTRMWEDAITFIPQADNPGLVKVDGPSRDTFRIMSNIYYNYRMSHPQDGE